MEARDLLQLQPGASRAYSMTLWRRIPLFLLSAVLLGAGFFLLAQQPSARPQATVTAGVLEFAMLMLGLYLALMAIQRRVQVDVDLTGRVTVKLAGVFRSSSMAAAEIRGRRKLRSRYQSFLILETAEPNRRKLWIPNSFVFDDAWNAWLASVPDLDLLDRAEILTAIAQSPELGDSADERLERLRSAKTIAYALSGLAIALGLCVWLARRFLDCASFGLLDAVLAILPWIALLLKVRSPLLYTAFPSKSDPRAPLYALLIVCGFSLLASPFDNLQTQGSLQEVGFGLIPSLILFFGFLKDSFRGWHKVRPMTTVLLFCGLYGFGLVRQMNTQLDSSTATEASAQVLRKSITHGRSTTYYLNLSPWQAHGGESRISVSSRLYNAVAEGDTVCIAAHGGALGLGWYVVNVCREDRPR
jgi:hypothetical protein